jgi:ElaB/YqjD/DUF883 family membrane-anchored ribosome-binding protein
MWDDTKRQRFHQLRDLEWQGALTAEEKAELSAMMQELCDMEAAYLQPATERLQQETAQLRSELEQALERNRRWDALIHRKQALIARVNEFVAETEAAREALQKEYQAILEEVEVSR